MHPKSKSFLVAIFVIALFVLVSYYTRQNIEFLKDLVGNDFRGILFYILITIFAIVFAPVSMMPLIPLASNLWGWQYAAMINVFGWAIGSFIVFFICRKYGIQIVKKFVSLEEIYKWESRIPKKKIFFTLILLRMTIPVDILSYALSLLTKINFKTYALTTIIGIIPFSFVFSYLGTIPMIYQIIGFILIGFVIVFLNKYTGVK
ncbi:VTT domain-containing protein [Candidatus Pacearchaeota archaeon]|nr:VTT domain-containing protein [Candidatus Pacearchaeota archaeon]